MPGRFQWRVHGDRTTSLRCLAFALRDAATGDGLICFRLLPQDGGQGDRFHALNLRLRELRAALTSLSASERMARQERDQVATTLYSIGDGVLTTDAEGRVERVNAAAARLLGLSESDAQGKAVETVFRVVNQFTRQTQTCPVRRCLETGRVVELAPGSILLARDGREYHVEDSAAPIRSACDRVTGAVLVFRDVSAQQAAKQQAQFLSEFDPLTTLYNRKSFERHLALASERASRSVGLYALVHIDLDQFLVINETFGHRTGDALLIQFAQFLRTSLHGGDIASRIGGDEFALLLAYRPGEQAALLDRLTDLLARLVGTGFESEGEVHHLRASAGLSYVDGSISPEDALRQADLACLLAKQAGRGRVRVYQDCDASAASSLSEMRMVREIRLAISENRFELVYQPVLGLDGPPVEYFEVLLRMRVSDGRMADTQLVIKAAERYDLIEDIDRWVIRRALAELAEAGPMRLPRLGINLSGTTLSERGFEQFFLRECHEQGIDPARICFEITETAAVVRIDRAIEVIRHLSVHGCEFALDDFGTGFSSFSYLKYLPVQYLKIDGGFVRGLQDSELDDAVVRSIAGIGGALGLRIIAESVENAEQIERLREIGIPLAQGWAYARPQSLTRLDSDQRAPITP
ncbi:putative bifunctional diguanylate cyclase/phosphodiesterase [Aquimonas voraii]|uniref:putative bifunctional diguanylate cyclase/phosphodiesterase n=1 Tax=Aquimonas voraii TaxID=265719 RepID=UPI0015A0632E|nr:EAL domain-containing protein [Aquimonas voraii]